MDNGRDDYEAPPPAEPENHIHCWHDTGKILTSYPGSREEVCCWCGLERRVPLGVIRRDEGHGPYQPQVLTAEGEEEVFTFTAADTGNVTLTAAPLTTWRELSTPASGERVADGDLTTAAPLTRGLGSLGQP